MKEQNEPQKSSPTRSPGDVILDLLMGKDFKPSGHGDYRKQSEKVLELASKIPCSPELMNEITFGSHEVFPMMAKKLEKHLGLTAKEWLKLSENYAKERNLNKYSW